MSEEFRFACRFGLLLFVAAWAFLCGVGLSYDVRRWLRDRREQSLQNRRQRLGSVGHV
jgi:hypothetical protein